MANSVVSESLRSAAKNSIGCLVIPVRLRRAIKKYIRENADRHLKKKVLRLSQSLNDAKTSNLLIAESETSRHIVEDPKRHVAAESSRRWKIQSSYGDNGLLYRDDEAIAYVASRMPAVFSACYRVLSEVQRRLPGFSPKTVLDFGAGTGSAFWALREVWPNSLNRVNIVEPSQSMQRAGQNLIQGLKGLPTIQSYDSIKNLFKKLKMSERKHDMVIASYVIGEIPSTKDQITTVRQLWQLTQDVLVLIEPGTPQGFKTISQMRSHILWMEKRKLRNLKPEEGEQCQDLTDQKNGAFIVAPCSHDGACPLEKSGTYCHFVQRLQRTNTQRQAKISKGRALRGFEDEKFSFVVIRKGKRPEGTWPLDGVKLENLKEQNARIKQEEFLEIDNEDFLQREEEEEEEALVEEEEEEEEEETLIAEKEEDGALIEEEEEEEEEALIPYEKRNRVLYESDEATDSDNESGVEEEDDENDNSEKEASADVGGGWGRIIFSPIRRGRHVLLNVCRSTNPNADEGVYEQIIMTKNKNPLLHRQARKSMWGDLWPN